MLDERWPGDAEELAEGLTAILSKECTPARVRAAEATEDGRDRALEDRLEEFGIWSLPTEPILLTRAALELGRFLAPVPFVETLPAKVALGTPNTAYGFEGDVPASLASVAVRCDEGVAVGGIDGPPRRTTAGDLLVTPELGSDWPTVGSPSDADRMWRLARLFAAARLVGAGQSLLTIGVDYAKARVQFGRPIGSFQAVAHRLVDSAILLAGADLLVRKTASLAAASPDLAPPLAFSVMVRAKAVEAARDVASTVHQVMGGFGFAMEYDCQLYSRRIRNWSQRLGPVAPDLVRLARMTLDPAVRSNLRHLWQHDRGIPLPRWAAEVDRVDGLS